MIIWEVLKLVRKKKELIPLITFVSIAGCGAAYMSMYSLSKPEVIVDRWNNPEPWDYVNPSKPQKLITVKQKWEPIEELQAVKNMTK
ncbi:normal mucosa of esophagus-specific gene 1 protein [Dromiciops gliroides]|uniref:normal mucosa of esophagus-specific gene 1 protein n=1 Tax=Dromiciops gliroides TaxID=33562 RepID=UPI001CC5BF4D|nr:normal mucosa of esophagus-specific gene 1 protein [Dromiciops gliroides]